MTFGETVDTWFLLFTGSSSDGRGTPNFVKRTISKVEAKRHYDLCKRDPYSIGCVKIVTDTELLTASDCTNWNNFK